MCSGGGGGAELTAEEERVLIRDIALASESGTEEGDTFYLLTQRWWQHWIEYVNQDQSNNMNDGPSLTENCDSAGSITLRKPSVIDNSDLIYDSASEESSAGFEIHDTLLEGRDYVLLPYEVWNQLYVCPTWTVKWPFNNDKPIKNNAFVTVKADSCCSPSSHNLTKPDVRGESYPFLNEKLHVDLPVGSRNVVAEVRQRSSLAEDSLVGTARIPVSDFVGGYTPENYLHFLSYRLKDAKGLRNGIINILVRVVTSSYKGASSSSSMSVPEFSIPVDREKKGGMVTGGTMTSVPIWYPNQCKS